MELQAFSPLRVPLGVSLGVPLRMTLGVSLVAATGSMAVSQAAWQ